jgi:hypothetical protein
MKLLRVGSVAAVLALGVLSCAELKHVGGALELQPPPAPPRAPERFLIDLGADSLSCLSQGQVLRFVLIVGQEAMFFWCFEPVLVPEAEGIKS